MNLKSFKSYFLLDNFKSLLNRPNEVLVKADLKSPVKGTEEQGKGKFSFCVKFITMSLSLAGILVFSLASTQKADAEVLKSQGVYIDAGLGWGKTNKAISGLTNKNTALAWNANIGYSFNEALAAEIGYWSFPRVKVDGTTFSQDNYVIDLALKGKINIHERLGVYAKAGIASATTKYTNTNVISQAGVSDGTYNKVTGLFGVGISYNFDEHTYFGVEGVTTLKRNEVPQMGAIVFNVGYII